MVRGGAPQTRLYIRPLRSGSTMLGQLLLQSVVILWLAQAAYTGGYGVSSGVSNGQGPHLNGRTPQNGGGGGVGRMLIPSKGVGKTMGAQGGYGGYPTKGVGYGPAARGSNGAKSNGYGAAAGTTNGGGMKGYGAAAGVTNGQGGKTQGGNPAVLPSGNGATTNGYGVQAGPTNGQQMKGNGYGAQAGGYGGQGTKGNVYRAPAGVAPNGNGGHLNGYGAVAGNGAKPNGYGNRGVPNGYGNKPNGYGAGAGVLGGNGAKPNSNNAAAAGNNGFATKGNGQGASAGPSSGNGARLNGQGGAGSKPMKGYGRPPYGAGPGVGMGTSRGVGVPQLARNQGQAYGTNRFNGYGAQPLGGYNDGYGHPGLGLGSQYGNGGMKGPKPGYSGAAGVSNGQGAKPNGYAGARVPNGNGAVPNGFGYTSGGASKPTKSGHGSFPNGYGAKPNGYGATRGGAMKPQPGYGAQAGGYGGQGTKGNGYRAPAGVAPNGNGGHLNGYGAAAGNGAKPIGYGNRGVPNGYGNKPNGYGAGAGVSNGYPAKPSGHGVGNGASLGGFGVNGYGGPNRGSKLQATKGVGAASPGEGTKTLGTGYGVPTGSFDGQLAKELAKATNAGYGSMPNGMGTKGAGVSNGKGPKSGALSPEQPSASPQEGAAPQQALTQGPAAPEPTSGILIMVTQEKYKKLPLPLPQGKAYKQTPLIPQATPEPAPVLHLGGNPQPALEPTPAVLSVQGKGPKAVTSGPAPAVPQSNPGPEPAAVLPQGYVTGSAVPEQTGAEADVLFGVDSTSEGEASPENTEPQKSKGVPETEAVKSTESFVPEEALAVGVPEVRPEETNVKSQAEARPDKLGVKGLPTGETGTTENGGGASVSKGQGAKASKPDCGPSGGLNGQWMKIPRPGYDGGAGASAGTNTKGYGAGAGVPTRYGAKPNGASAGGYSNGGGAKANKPGYGAGGYPVPGLGNGYGAGFRYPYAGVPKQPGYGQGAYLGAGYRNGNSYGGNTNVGEAAKSKPGYGNGYNAGAQPDYASLGQGVPSADAKSGGARQTPYNGAPAVPAGLDGISQPEPQSAALGPNGKLGNVYGGGVMGGLPFGGQTFGMGAEKSNAKYGIGGLQFGGQPLSTGTNGAGKYGYGAAPYGAAGDAISSGKYGDLGAGMGGNPAAGKYGYGGFPNGGQLLGLGSNGNLAGKYGYGRMPYDAQTAGLSPEAKSAGKHGVVGSQYQPEAVALGPNGKLTNKYGNQGVYQSQPLESASEGTSDTADLPYETLLLQPDSAGKSYVKGELPTPATAAAVDGVSVGRYENVGYINGQVQPEVVEFPAAPTSSPTLAYPSAQSYVPAESFTPDVAPGVGVEDLPDPVGTGSLDSAPVSETHGVMHGPEQTQDLQQLPRQIHIQQHLKLHFHPQGAKNGKYDLNGFFGNSGHQG